MSFDKKTAEVTYDPARTDPDQLCQGLAAASGGRYSMQVRR